MLKHKPIFVTGTDTGVGKTVVTAALTAYLRRKGINAGAFKPIETGVDTVPKDGRFLREITGMDEELTQIVPDQFRDPLAPSVAARRENREVDQNKINDAFQYFSRHYSPLFVEGAGGLIVPLNNSASRTIADLPQRWDLPVLVVSRPALGTLNHTALTVEALRNRNLDIHGIVISNYPNNPGIAEKTNPEEIEKLTNTPVLGILPSLPDLDTSVSPSDGLKERLVESVEKNINIERIESIPDKIREDD